MGKSLHIIIGIHHKCILLSPRRPLVSYRRHRYHVQWFFFFFAFIFMVDLLSTHTRAYTHTHTHTHTHICIPHSSSGSVCFSASPPGAYAAFELCSSVFYISPVYTHAYILYIHIYSPSYRNTQTFRAAHVREVSPN